MNDGIAELVRRKLGETVDLPGSVFYSGQSSIKNRDYYLLGLNPGGNPACNRRSILTSLDEDHPDYSAYTSDDEAWGQPGQYKPGNAPLQLAVQEIAETTGQQIRKLFSTNAFFMQSRGQKELVKILRDLPHAGGRSAVDYWSAVYWPVHQHFLSIVEPKVIICVGNGGGLSAYSLIRSQVRGLRSIKPIGEYGSSYIYKECRGTLVLADGKQLEVKVIGALHFGYFKGEKVRDTFVEILRSRI